MVCNVIYFSISWSLFLFPLSRSLSLSHTPLTPSLFLSLPLNSLQAQDQGLGSSVCTLYEIHSGEYSTEQEFHDIELWMLKKAVEALAREGKAELIPGSSPDDSDAGVKFFS